VLALLRQRSAVGVALALATGRRKCRPASVRYVTPWEPGSASSVKSGVSVLAVMVVGGSGMTGRLHAGSVARREARRHMGCVDTATG